MPYNGKNNIFIKIIIEKRYSLPISVLRKSFEYFMKFEKVDLKLPVFNGCVWVMTVVVFLESC